MKNSIIVRIELFRWIIYNPKHGVDYDASMVPAEWFGWLHYKTDKTPIEKVGKGGFFVNNFVCR